MGQQQLEVGSQLFPYVPEVGAGLIVDAGCGSGLVADALLQRHPQAQLLAVDLSAEMLRLARHQLSKWGPRVHYSQADMQDFTLPGTASCIYSNAALHWVADHGRLFEHLHGSLMPGGVLAAHMACPGPHNRGLFMRLNAAFSAPPFAPFRFDVASPVEPVCPQREATSLAHAGFIDIRLQRLTHIFTFRSTDEHRVFMEKVVLRPHMAALPTDELRQQLIDRVLDYTDSSIGPLRQCYESLRCIARR